ncbi:MAG: LPS export ABC transporter ATP-binding protein [Planctomycetota bacterium]
MSTATTTKLLRAQNLIKNYGKRRVVDNISFEVAPGEIVGLLGPNGAGKTTTFRMTVGMVSPTAGDVFLNDEKITHLPMYKRARKGMGYLTQEPSIFTKLTVEQNIMAILENQKLSRKECKEKLQEYLEELDLSHLKKNIASSLSGGERRRLEITRALVTNPKLLLLDEPFAGVDPINVEEIQRIIRKLKQKNIGILLTDHNVRETLLITDRAYIISEGRILVHGKPEELVNNPQARQIYLGTNFYMPEFKPK